MPRQFRDDARVQLHMHAISNSIKGHMCRCNSYSYTTVPGINIDKPV